MKMNGTSKSLYEMQTQFQQILVDNCMYGGGREEIKPLPSDIKENFSYHIQAMVEELGELLREDKRWKNYRNDNYNRENKLNELCDCFITLMNISIFSGFTEEELKKSIKEKILVNTKRALKELE